MLNVYIYWDKGYEFMPPMIKYIYDYNLKTSIKYNFKIHLFTDYNINKFITLPKRFYDLAVNFKSDIIRFYILHKYGGAWFDTDVIIIKNIKLLYKELLNSNKYAILDVETKIDKEILGCCSLFMKPNTPFSFECINYINQILEKKKEIERVEIGPGTIWNVYPKFKNSVIVNDYTKTKDGCNFISWNDNPGIDKSKWYYKNKAISRNKSCKIIKNKYCYYVMTWQIYKENDIKENIIDFVFKDKSSVFYYLCS